MAMLYWFKCNDCDKYFPSKITLMRHSRHSHPSGPKNPRVLCDFCSETFYDSKFLYNHINKQHLDSVRESWTGCKVCGYHLPTSHAMVKHVQSSHPKYHQKLLSLCSSKPGDILPCKFCNKTFKQRRGYYAHANKIHKDLIEASGWQKCLQCSKHIEPEMVYKHELFCPKRASQLDSGTYNSQETKPQCCFCSKIFSRQSAHVFHVNRCHKDQLDGIWHECSKCHTHYPTENSKLSHESYCQRKQGKVKVKVKKLKPSIPQKKLVVAKRKKKNKTLTEKPELEQPSWPCQYCVKTHSSNKKRLTHIRLYHRNEIESVWLHCQKCQELFPDSEQLGKHLSECDSSQSAEPTTWQCQYCEKTLRSERQYLRHCRSFHREEIKSLWIHCQNCQLLFSDSGNLERHLIKCLRIQPEPIVSEEKPQIPCQYCSERFLRMKAYIAHSNDSHRKEIEEDPTAAKIWDRCHSCKKFIPVLISIRKHLESCKDLK